MSHSIAWIGFVVVSASLFVNVRQGVAQEDVVERKAQQRVRTELFVELDHRWEDEPTIYEWTEQVPIERPARLVPDRFRSSIAEVRYSEARQASWFSNAPNLENGKESLAEIMRCLEEGEENAEIRVALVNAAVALGDAAAINRLWELFAEDESCRSIVESGLIESSLIDESAPDAQAVWLARVQSPDEFTKFQLSLALRGLEKFPVSEADDELRELTFGAEIDEPIRLAAARALATCINADAISPTDLDRVQGDPVFRDLIIAALLQKQTSSLADATRLEVVRRDLGAASTLAAKSVFQLQAANTREVAELCLGSFSSESRLLAVDYFVSLDTVDGLKQIAGLLGDRNPTVRNTARLKLIQSDPSGDKIIGKLLDEAFGQDWDDIAFERLEQCVLLTVGVFDKSRLETMIRLLDHPEYPVNVRAGWAVQLLVDTQEQLRALVPMCEDYTDRIASRDRSVTESDVARLSFVFEAFGHTDFKETDAMLRRYIPKRMQLMRAMTRGSAIWTLGRLNRGTKDPELNQLLAERVLDSDYLDQERGMIRFLCIVSMVAIDAPNAEADIESAIWREPEEVGYARTWALNKYAAETGATANRGENAPEEDR